MKKLMICSATLALTLVVAPSYADNWERQMRQHDMMMADQSAMYSGWEMQSRYDSVEEHRRRMLERGAMNSFDYIDTMPETRGAYATTSGGVRSIDDIENLPSTAAGYPDTERSGMLHLDSPQERRRGYRGGMRYDF